MYILLSCQTMFGWLKPSEFHVTEILCQPKKRGKGKIPSSKLLMVLYNLLGFPSKGNRELKYGTLSSSRPYISFLLKLRILTLL